MVDVKHYNLQTSVIEPPLPSVELLFGHFESSDKVQIQEHKDPFEHFQEIGRKQTEQIFIK